MTTPAAAPVAPAATAAPAVPAESGAGDVNAAIAEVETKAQAGDGKTGATKPPEGGEVESVKKEENPANPDKPYKIKVEGKEYAMSLDDLQRYASKGIGLERKLQNATRGRQNAERLFHLLKTDPMAILTNPKVGIDFKKLAQEYLLQEIEKEKMTPEQREVAEAKDKIKALEDEKKQREDDLHNTRMKALVEHSSKEIEVDMKQALETSGLPKTRGTVKRLAYYMAQGLQRGYKLTAADVVPLVQSDYRQEIAELFSLSDGDAVAKMLGDPVIKKLMDAQLKRLNGAGAPPASAATTVNVPANNSAPKKMDKDEWREHMDRIVAA